MRFTDKDEALRIRAIADERLAGLDPGDLALLNTAEWLDQLEPASRELLERSWPDATKVFSARGLDNYVKGAAALRGLGRGHELVNAWIDSAPQVAQEIGEDVVGELATTALTLASKTSGAVIELVLATAPTAEPAR